MSYEKQTWQTGEVITASKLNHMEDGIAESGSGSVSYEKQTWETGEVITASKLNHMEDGIAEAGSGSGGDASIAHVTVDTSFAPSMVYFQFYLIVGDDEFGGTYSIDGQSGNEVETYNVILYKGVFKFSNEQGYNIEATGAAEATEWGFDITGDCVLTFKSLDEATT